ncbi:hypothetical protein [Thioclava sp. A2]|uniref:hypothetical protein n=1 Tax=Thioclava sp. FCG-A2 TaxID=3080562 RepID=UPI00295494BB|nr:hypothetical protein [Thioclava sp. A2]
MASFLSPALAGVLAFDFFNADDTGTGSVAARVDDLHGNGDTIEGSMLDDFIFGDGDDSINAVSGDTIFQGRKPEIRYTAV